MPCSVYCLVPSAAQLEPLVDRLKDAGVASRDIMVVVRDEAAAAAPVQRPAPTCWWSLPLTPAGLWWMSLYGWTAVLPPARGSARAAEAAGSEHEVISLARYRAGRGGGR